MPARDLALIAVFAGLLAALSLIPPIYVPISPVPITVQSFGVILAGAILGPYRGAASQVLFLTLVAIGLPLLSGGRGGIGVFAGPTVGFMIGWIAVAFFIGWATWKVGAPYKLIPGIIINLIGAFIVMYAFGTVGMVARTQLSFGGALVANVPFFIGDAIKAVLAAFIALGVHKAYPGLLPYRERAAKDALREPAFAK